MWEGANTDPSAPPARQTWACRMLRVTFALLGAGPPQLVPPFSGSAEALFFLGTQQMGGGAVGTHFWGASVAALFWGWAQSLQAWPGRMVCCNFGCLWLRRDRARDTGHGGKARSWFNPRDGVSVCLVLRQHKTPAVSKHPDIFIKSLIKTPGRELIAFHSSAGSDAKQLLGRWPRRQQRHAVGFCRHGARGSAAAVLASSQRGKGLGMGGNWGQRGGCHVLYQPWFLCSASSCDASASALENVSIPGMVFARKARAGQRVSSGMRRLNAFPGWNRAPRPRARWRVSAVRGSDAVWLPIAPGGRQTPGRGA